MKRLIIGCGYLGRRVAGVWRDRGDDVWALTRSPLTAAAFEAAGLRAIVGDVLDRTSLRQLLTADTVLYAVGYDRSAAPSKREVYVDGLRNVLMALPSDTGRLIAISSSSVYGQSGGEWVDESSPCDPVSEGGRICLDAEDVARSSFRGPGGVCVLRLSGIYGPGRLAARIESLKQQRPIAAHPDGWLNLIHVEDAGAAVLACADLDESPETLLVTDDQPLLRHEYYAQLAAAIGSPPPVFDTGGRTGDRGKRCSNRLLHESLGFRLSYPTIQTFLSNGERGALEP